MRNEYEFETLAARTHGRIYHRSAAGEMGSLLLVGFHGYGESAEDLIRELDRIPGSDAWSLASIQGLHRLYNRRTGGVVASWMTRQDREIAIADNLAYVAAALRRLRAGLEVESPVVYVGFSQGTAMAYRAAAGIDSPCGGVIALGGDVPPELAEADLGSFPPVLIGRGDKDEWYDENKLSGVL
ncbi:MAG: alpha/beta fold hydrolase, partial [Acidobacteriota bacterium]